MANPRVRGPGRWAWAALGAVACTLVVFSTAARDERAPAAPPAPARAAGAATGLRGGADPPLQGLGEAPGAWAAPAAPPRRLAHTEGGELLEGALQPEAPDDSRTQALAVLIFSSFFVLFGVGFEKAQEALVEATNEHTRPIVNALFAELTTLGFVGVLMFLVQKTADLETLSRSIFDDDDGDLLTELLELVHMVLFLIMIVFLLSVLALVYTAAVLEKDWLERETETHHEENVILRGAQLVDPHHLPPPDESGAFGFVKLGKHTHRPHTRKSDVRFTTPRLWESLLPCTVFRCCRSGRDETKARRALIYTTLRARFIEDSVTRNAREESARAKAANGAASAAQDGDVDPALLEFDFAEYLGVNLGHCLAEIVDLHLVTWLALELMVVLFWLVYTYAGVDVFEWLLLSTGYVLCAIMFATARKMDVVIGELTSPRLLYRAANIRFAAAALVCRAVVRFLSNGRRFTRASKPAAAPNASGGGGGGSSRTTYGSDGARDGRRPGETELSTPLLGDSNGGARSGEGDEEVKVVRTASQLHVHVEDPNHAEPKPRAARPKAGSSSGIGGSPDRQSAVTGVHGSLSPPFLKGTRVLARSGPCKRCWGRPPTAHEKLFWFDRFGPSFTLHTIRTIMLLQSLYLAAMGMMLVRSGCSADEWQRCAIMSGMAVAPVLATMMVVPWVIQGFVIATSIETMSKREVIRKVLLKQRYSRAMRALRMISAMKIHARKFADTPGGSRRAGKSSVDVYGDAHTARRRRRERELRSVFKLFDKDGTGSVEEDELKAMLMSMGMHDEAASTARAIMAEIDVDGGGSITFDEFVEWMAMQDGEREDMSEEEMYRSIFELIDRDNSGEVNAEELRETLEALGEGLTHDDVLALVREADEDGNGTIDLEEFITMLQRHSKHKEYGL